MFRVDEGCEHVGSELDILSETGLLSAVEPDRAVIIEYYFNGFSHLNAARAENEFLPLPCAG
jgi:hypothetical protein